MNRNTIVNHYSYRVQYSPEDKEYVGTCIELPGLSWLDETPAATLNGIQKVVNEAVADMEAHGESIPEPYADRQYSGRFVIRLTPEEHRHLAMEAAEQGVSLNRLAIHKLTANQ